MRPSSGSPSATRHLHPPSCQPPPLLAQSDGFDWQAVDSFGITGINLGASSIKRQSAEAPKGTRGLTLQALHSSEVAFWPSTTAKSADETSAALRSALAKHAQTCDIEESTPKGASGIFYTLWQDARWPEYDDYWKRWQSQAQDVGEGNGYIRVFAAWFEFDDYALPLSCDQEGEDIQATLTAREKRGIELYDWTLEQIKWRRLTIKRDCLNDERRFDEEYPEDPVSCFLSSGSPRFDTEGLTRLELRSRSVGVEHGILSLNGEKVSFQRTGENESMCSVWEMPRVGCSYLISVDPSLIKQGLSMVGLKVENAKSARSQMYRIAEKFRPEQPGGGNRAPSPYSNLRRLLDYDDTKGATEEVQRLVDGGKPLKTIAAALGAKEGGGMKPELFTGSAETERKMLASLTPEQRKLWMEAQKERATSLRRFGKVAGRVRQPATV